MWEPGGEREGLSLQPGGVRGSAKQGNGRAGLLPGPT